MWSVPRMWVGDTVFIVAGGPSFTPEHAAALRGRRVIAVNSAWETIPHADVLFFGDARWWKGTATGKKDLWDQRGEITTKNYRGLIVTSNVTVVSDRVRNLGKIMPPKWSSDPRRVAMQWSSVTGAMNFADLAGARRIVLCGVDGRFSADKRRHHHGSQYPWPFRADSFDLHGREFRNIAPALAGRITVTIANPESVHTMWPRRRLEECLDD